MTFAELEIGDSFVISHLKMRPATKVTKTSFLCGNCSINHKIDPFTEVKRISSAMIKSVGSIVMNVDRRGVPLGL